MTSPQGDLKVVQRSISVTGLTSPDAVVSVNGILAAVDAEGNFSAENVPLDEGPNVLEIIASDLSGDIATETVAVAVTEGDAVFGVVSSIDAVGLGLVRIVVDSLDGSQTTVQSTLFTGVLIPGKASAVVEDIRVGDSLVATGSVSAGVVSADLITVKPPSPVSYAHMVAALVGVSPTGDAQLMDAQGNLVTVTVSTQVGTALQPAGIITGVLNQDLKTGELALSGAENADDSVSRLATALEEAAKRGAQDNEDTVGTQDGAGRHRVFDHLYGADFPSRSQRSLYIPASLQHTTGFLVSDVAGLGVGSGVGERRRGDSRDFRCWRRGFRCSGGGPRVRFKSGRRR